MQWPDLSVRADWVSRYCHLLHHFGGELGRRPLVLQTGEFFPDAFHGDEASLQRLLRRLQGHAGMLDVPITAMVTGTAGGGCDTGGGCGTGGCGTGGGSAGSSGSSGPGEEAEFVRLAQLPSAWLINVQPAELHHPVALTTVLARSLARIFMVETEHGKARYLAPLEESVDIVATALGFGPLLLEGSHIYGKGCGGPSVQQLTALGTGDLAVVTALFVEHGGHSPAAARKTLSTTQKDRFDQAIAWVRSNRRALAPLRDMPLAVDVSELTETQSLLERFWSERKAGAGDGKQHALRTAESAPLETASLAAWQRARQGTSPAPAPKRPAQDDDLKALVAEALKQEA